MKKQLQKTPTQIALTIILVSGLIITGRFINNNCKVMNIEIQANQETAPSFFNLFY